MVGQTGNPKLNWKCGFWQCCLFCLVACGGGSAENRAGVGFFRLTGGQKRAPEHPPWGRTLVRIAVTPGLPSCSGLSDKFTEMAEMIKLCDNLVSLPLYLWCHERALAARFREFIRVNSTSHSEVRTKYFQLLSVFHVEIETDSLSPVLLGHTEIRDFFTLIHLNRHPPLQHRKNESLF